MNHEPKSHAWPLLIIGLAIVTAGVWKLAPVVYSAVPPEAKSALAKSFERCFAKKLVRSGAEVSPDSGDWLDDSQKESLEKLAATENTKIVEDDSALRQNVKKLHEQNTEMKKIFKQR